MIRVRAEAGKSINTAVDAVNDKELRTVVELDQIKVKIGNYEEPLSELKESLGLDMKQERIDQLEAQMEGTEFLG